MKPTKTFRQNVFLVLMLCVSCGMLHANNIQVSNTKLTGQNTTAGVNNASNYTLVQFDLSWENSWRVSTDPSNWDAAWVFVKYRIPVANGGDGLWKHAWLNNSGHNGGTGTGATISPGLQTPGSAFHATTNPALGAFVFRSGPGSGTFSAAAMQLRLNYGDNSVADDAVLDVRVFAIEMVYVPQGAFAAGDGSIGFTLTTINTANATTAPAGTGSLGGEAGGYLTGQTASDNASWPYGYGAFYCMKYEITQQQYVDFLNTLTQNQAHNRKYTGSSYRYAITGNTVGSYATTNPFVACNFLSWMDGAAYVDWAGLHPMTELEFEKAYRGTATPESNEYAWGNTLLTRATGINNPGLPNEVPNPPDANVNYLQMEDPLTHLCKARISSEDGIQCIGCPCAFAGNWVAD